jgi:hypothetical protein
MMRSSHRMFAALAIAVSTLAFGACSDTTGPDGVGQASVVLTSDAAAASVSPELSLSVAGDVPTSAVSNLFLAVTRVDLHLVGGDAEEGEESEDGGAWVSLELSLLEPVDILALAGTGVELAAGTVPAGTYNQARIYFETSELVLGEQIVVNGLTLDPGSYDVTVPSAAESGLKIQFSATDVAEVVEGEVETVGIVVGMDATIGTLVWNANGFQLSPVLN